MPGIEMRELGLHQLVEWKDKNGKDQAEWVRITDHFETSARVSDPHSGGAYGLLVEFEDERGRQKQVIIPATDFHGHPRDICSKLSEQGLYIDRDHQQEL